jgi:pyridoxal 5'-phosphate synthase pdxT subunit
VPPSFGNPELNQTNDFSNLTIGVVAMQGAFIEHVRAIESLGARTRQVRLPSDLAGLDGLILPGGESTSIGKLLVEFGLLEPLREWARRGRPIYGTCAGAILLARDIGGLDQPLIGVLDIKVQRNAFGRQLQSFETPLDVPALGVEPFPAIFIRAPAIESIGDWTWRDRARQPAGRSDRRRQGRTGPGNLFPPGANRRPPLPPAFFGAGAGRPGERRAGLKARSRSARFAPPGTGAELEPRQ